MRWPELALPAEVVAATMHDGVNGKMVQELRALLHDAAFSRALKVRSRGSWALMTAHYWDLRVNIYNGT